MPLAQYAVSLAINTHNLIQRHDPAGAQVGAARFTVLTPRLLRMEWTGGKGGSGGGDDRATLAVINRALPVPAFTQSLNATTLTIATSAATLTYTLAGSGPGNSTCSDAQPGTDQAGGERVPDYPGGTSVASQAACCAACDADTYCTAWVWATNIPSPGVNCWLMMDVAGTTPTGNRVFGGAAESQAFNADNLRVDFTVNGAPATWRAGQSDPANLNGTYAALDCYSTPMQCRGEYDGRMGAGLISTAGWAVVDDTQSGRFSPLASSPYGGVWLNTTLTDTVDWYLLAHGLDYAGALGEWASVSGAMAIPPRSVFGPWYSR